MKLLKIKVNNYKNLIDDFTFDLYSKAYKSELDKSTELQEIAENLYSFNTISIIGKNASGKTMVFSLLENIYIMFRDFRIKTASNIIGSNKNNIDLELYFLHKNRLYKYTTEIYRPENIFSSEFYLFSNQKLYSKEYKKTNFLIEKDNYFFDCDYEEEFASEKVPADMSKVYLIYKEKEKKSICLPYASDDYEDLSLSLKMVLDLYKENYLNNSIIVSILNILDTSIEIIKEVSNDDIYIKRKNDNGITLKFEDFLETLSSGTKKGIVLFSYAYTVLASKNGDGILLIDEIENHFHKKIVEYIITLFNDKEVNKNNATLIFTTHYCEILDNFRRSDNIWLVKSNDKIIIENLYEKYDLRKDLLKSKKFYSDAFDTKISYDSLIKFRKEIL